MTRFSFSTTENYPEWNLLLTWVAVVEAASVSGAARLLGFSQAAVSQRIKQLEAAMSTELLDRSTRPARPTPAGELLFEHAARLLAQAGDMTESVRNLSRAKRNIVRFGCVDSFAGTLGPTLIHGLSGASRQIRLWSGITPVLDKQLEDRQLDLVVTTSASAGKPNIRKYSLFSEPYVLIVPRSMNMDRIDTLKELGKRAQFIRYSARSFIGAEIDRLVESHGVTIERTYEFDNTDPLLSLVTAGLGFGISTPLCIWQSRHFLDQLRVLPLAPYLGAARADDPSLSRTLFLAARQQEVGKLPFEARDVILMAMERLIQKELAPALGLPPATLWRSLRR
ncbi:LysR family transcriptional regulator [Achromobacter mucicolens]|jgi:DNA-binding transcriptional LysR family regulator|uniref:LysR family transcriptional regulator n=1 Tax=Achromobacter TaxID=222 RepID=UPI0006FFE83B|nr:MULTISPECIES: LysR family transcriptional regulator [Achromobacter]KXJ64354.1 LysR family transcriptional regulator [Achromobacter xylosoxidans]KRB17068.1 LysR family transcriptional regulator [Achromobacter sp. Root170]MDF2862651.1 LysR family transcriptional regulator [Achromobacter mucicolens]MDH1521838.1 LysR family transcriptional regulator [Achromobacter mucicolens]TQJ93418.1 DNA-binding transcriptional LysR family regulator [Achromobacter sp. SLBN-14]